MELLSSDQTYASKFYKPHLSAIIEENRALFEPDADATTETLESMRNNPGKNVHSFDCMNDQENSNLQDELLNDFRSQRVVYNFCHPWRVFKMIELTEITRQKNKAFTELLNRIRTASHTEDDTKVIQSRPITPSDHHYPSDTLHIWAENAPVNEHNESKLETI